MKTIIMLIAVMSLSGCGVMKCTLLDDCKSTQSEESSISSVPTVRVFDTGQQIQEYATVIITRDNNFVDSGCFDVLSVNGKMAARVGINERLTLKVVPGELTIKASTIDNEGPSRCYLGGERDVIREFVIAKGATKKFRIIHNLSPVDIDIQKSE